MDEAIIRIVIQDADSRVSGVPEDTPPTAATADVAPVTGALTTLRTAISTVTADILKSAESIRSVPRQPLALPDYSSEYYTDVKATPAERLKELHSKGRYKASKEEIEQFSPAELQAYQKEMDDYARELKHILDSARLTAKERETAEQLFAGEKVNITSNLAKKLGLPQAEKSVSTPAPKLSPHAKFAKQYEEFVASKTGGEIGPVAPEPAKGLFDILEEQGREQAERDQMAAGESGIEWAREPAAKKYVGRVPARDKLIKKLEATWIKEASKKDRGRADDITAVLNMMLEKTIDPDTIDAARQALKAKDLDAALALFGVPHMAGGGIPAMFGTPSPDFPTPPPGFDVSFMSMYPKDAMQRVFRAGHDRSTAEAVAEYVYKYSLDPKNVYKRVLGNIGDRSENVDMDAALAAARRATDAASGYKAEYPHFAEGGEYDPAKVAREAFAAIYSGEHLASGGRVDMTRGGQMPNTGMAASGADWHPAWLTDREFVVNAKSAATNMAALAAANANPDVRLEAKHMAAGGIFTGLNAASYVEQLFDELGLTSTVGPQGPQQPTVSPQTMQSITSAVGVATGPVGQAAMVAMYLVGDAQRKFQEAVVGSVDALGEWTRGLANPDANPAIFMSALGDVVSGGGEKLSNGINKILNPVGSMFGIDMIPGLKLFTGVVGTATTQLAMFMDAVSATATRYGEYNPNIAVAEAMVEVQHTMGELRRAQEAGPELARYLRAQGDLQQRVEDIKIRLLTKLLPLVTAIVSSVESVMSSGEDIRGAMVALTGPFAGILAALDRIANAQEDANRPEFLDPTETVLLRPETIGVPNA